MPSNPSKDQQRARIDIGTLMNNLRKSNQEVELVTLEYEMLLKHAIPDSYPRKFIKKFFLDTEVFVLVDGWLRPNNKRGGKI